MTRAKSLAPLAILGLLFLIPAFTQDSYYLYLIYNFFIWAVVAVSLIVNIRTGIFNFASAAFMGIGAYTTAILVVKVGVSFWLTLLIGPLVGAVVAVLIGIPMLRLKGMYFVLVTALFCQIFILTIVSLSEQTGGWFGIAGIYAPTLFGIDLSDKVPFYYLVLVFMSLSFIILYRIWNSYLGKIYAHMGENEALAQSVGVPVTMYKVQSFAVASFFTSLAGCFLAASTSYIEPGMFSFFASIKVWLYAVLGGVTSVFGPILGTGVASGITEWLRGFLLISPIILGVFVIVVIIFLPRGFISLPEKIPYLIGGIERITRLKEFISRRKS